MRSEIVQRIHEEVAQLQAYCKIWQSSAGYVKNGERSIGSELKERVTDVVHPWPQIQKNPTGYREDGRFAKSFPLELPFGVGDLYQPRLRNDLYNGLGSTAVAILRRTLYFLETRESLHVGYF